MTEPTWRIGRDAFGYLHEFHWSDHRWNRSIPLVADLETFEVIVAHEHPELLKVGVGNIEHSL